MHSDLNKAHEIMKPDTAVHSAVMEAVSDGKQQQRFRETLKQEDFDFTGFIHSALVRDFIGRNYEHFKTIWIRDFEKHKNLRRMRNSMHWNSLAILASPAVWFCYRKMYLTTLGFIMGTIVIALIGESMGWGVASYLALPFIFGIMAKNMYFDHVLKFYLKYKDAPPDIQNTAIQKSGGVHLWAALLMAAFVALCALMTLSTALAGM